MLFFTSKKPILADLIPNNYVDIHSHLLPAIDDGSPTTSTTLHLILELQKIGFAEFITTPHIMELIYPNTDNTILKLLDQTKIEIEKANIATYFSAAAEYMMDANFSNALHQKKILPLKENYVLVEMSYVNAPLNLYDIIFDMQLQGYQPVLAHPERYAFLHSKLDEYKKLKNAGCLFQMNLLSTVGYYGKGVSKVADYLLLNAMIDFVGSDVHHHRHTESFYKKIVLKNHDKLPQLIQNNLFFSSK